MSGEGGDEENGDMFDGHPSNGGDSADAAERGLDHGDDQSPAVANRDDAQVDAESMHGEEEPGVNNGVADGVNNGVADGGSRDGGTAGTPSDGGTSMYTDLEGVLPSLAELERTDNPILSRICV